MHSAVPGRSFAGQREARLCRSPVENTRANVFSDGWAMLKTMTRAAAHQPNIFQVRVPVDEEISIRGVFVLADAELRQWCVAQVRETLRQERPGLRDALRTDTPVA